MSSSAAVARLPLVVDLDGTLLATDTLWEGLFAYLKANPLGFVSLIRWLLSGKAHFKSRLAAASTLDVAALPYRTECLTWLREERRTGRSIWLATGANERVARSIADHLGLFAGVIASNGNSNVTGRKKAERIAEEVGDSYDYAGNALVDLAIWKGASSVIVVAPNRGVLAALKRENIPVTEYFPAATAGFRTWARALRVHQWVKNLLILTPILTAHRIFDLAAWTHALAGFVSFSLVASATYLLNDLLDLPADRHHATKSKRPLASGAISIPTALLVSTLLVATATCVSAFMPVNAGLLLLAYSAATVLYSTVLKKLLVADVVALALFYTMRLLYGGEVTHIDISMWTLAFCGFSFFSMAAAKRINDLAKTTLLPQEALRHRAYRTQDLGALVALAAATSNIAVLVLILYINSPQVEPLYRHPRLLWTMCVPLLYWFSRIITLANRGVLEDDPILFATKDRATYLVAGVLAVIALAAA